ncbi:hypothetical protein HYV44_03240 [Candidatus Microgenomates bacterium]|nr:hypothetical protein [Candidatus Microgenomates bacterium]
MIKKPRLFRNIHLSLGGLVIYLTILVVVSVFLFGIRSSVSDKMFIYVQKEKPDFLQVFFPIDGLYSEENSQRSELFDNTKNVVEIALPLRSFDHIRIDPINEASEVVITKIEVKTMFGTETLMPSDIIAHAKPLQMIDRLEIVPSGLLIRSTGNDPFFELQLEKSFNFSQLIVFGVVGLLLSLLIFFGGKKILCLKIPKKGRTFCLLAIPLFISVGIAALFYPGFMSYDTLHALRGARNGVVDSVWPPMVSYVWRVVDMVSTNPSAMHFSQVSLLIGSIFGIVVFFTKRIKYASVFLVLYLAIPVILGTVSVIWKDVLMASFFLAGFAVVLYMKPTMNKWKFVLLAVLAGILIFLGVCSRHNAIFGAVPLVFYMALVLCSRISRGSTKKLLFGTILVGIVLTSLLFASKTVLDNHILPSFKKLENNTDGFLWAVRNFDVAGASLCVGKNLFADMAPDLTVAEIGRIYNPKHVNLSAGLSAKVGVDSRIDKIWLDVALRHPICFWNNKFQMTKYMLGANRGEQFIITAPAISENEYGYKLPKSPLRDVAVGYIIKASNWLFFRPWFLYFLSIIAFVYMLRVRALKADLSALFLSGLFYLASLILFGNAADARLPFYTTTALLILTFVAAIKLWKRCGEKRIKD